MGKGRDFDRDRENFIAASKQPYYPFSHGEVPHQHPIMRVIKRDRKELRRSSPDARKKRRLKIIAAVLVAFPILGGIWELIRLFN